MKSRLAAFVLALLLTAGLASAAEMQTVLTPDSTLFAIDARGEYWRLDLHLRKGETKTTLVVPGTDNDDIESDARLLWDSKRNTLFVVWRSTGNERDAIMMASLDKDRVWSEPFEIAGGVGGKNLGLQTVVTYAKADDEGNQATLLHAAWWSVTGYEAIAEYALIAFENGQRVSAEVETLNDLHEYRADGTDERENTGVPLHPPLAMARAEDGVDVVYGAAETTKLTKLRIEPRLVIGNARIWKPLGKNGGRTGPARLVTADASPVQAFISNGRIVLYKPDAQFRFVVLDNGKWSEEYMIQLDEKLSSDQMLRELRRTVDEMDNIPTGPIVQ